LEGGGGLKIKYIGGRGGRRGFQIKYYLWGGRGTKA
jgi:hypothetical protein